MLAGNAGIFVTRVLYVKETDVKRFVIVDGAMNDLIRPVLYEAYHEIQPVIRRESPRMIAGDVVGPVCESGDFLALARELPEVESGDLLAVMSAGAYGFVMASNYNSRPRSAELLINGAETHVIRERDSFEDIIRNEKIVTLSARSRCLTSNSSKCMAAATTMSMSWPIACGRRIRQNWRGGLPIAVSVSAAMD